MFDQRMGMMCFCTKRLHFVFGNDVQTGRECPRFDSEYVPEALHLNKNVSPCWLCSNRIMGKPIVKEYKKMVHEHGLAFSSQQKKYLDMLVQRGIPYPTEDAEYRRRRPEEDV